MLCFFFFQAEDGIRDYKVTGVQTCALPISAPTSSRSRFSATWVMPGTSVSARSSLGCRPAARSSEERRVGKECRSRWSPYHYKKKASSETTPTMADKPSLFLLDQH